MPWYDIVLMLCGTGAFLYYTANAMTIIQQGSNFAWYQIVIGIVGVAMALTTYLIRMLPLTIFRKPIRSLFLRSFLHYVPYAVLAAMTIPGILSSTGDIRTAAAGVIVAVVMAWRGCSLLTVAIGACAAVAAAQGVMLLL